MSEPEFRSDEYLRFLVSLDHVEANIRDNLAKVAIIASKGVESDEDQAVARRVCQYVFAIFMKDLSKEEREAVQKALENNDQADD